MLRSQIKQARKNVNVHELENIQLVDTFPANKSAIKLEMWHKTELTTRLSYSKWMDPSLPCHVFEIFRKEEDRFLKRV